MNPTINLSKFEDKPFTNLKENNVNIDLMCLLKFKKLFLIINSAYFFRQYNKVEIFVPISAIQVISMYIAKSSLFFTSKKIAIKDKKQMSAFLTVENK